MYSVIFTIQDLILATNKIIEWLVCVCSTVVVCLIRTCTQELSRLYAQYRQSTKLAVYDGHLSLPTLL